MCQTSPASSSWAQHNFVQANHVAYNRDAGISIQSGEGNRIHHNDLTGNGKLNASDKGKNNYWDDGREGNYWSDYKGNDANGDGVGDTPYQIPPNGVDRYPLMKPFEAEFTEIGLSRKFESIWKGLTCTGSYLLSTMAN